MGMIADANAGEGSAVEHGSEGPATAPARPRAGRAAAQARDAILQLIQDGVFAPNEKLPGERDLAEMVKVSRTVLRNALSRLESEGYLESSPWRGWFVHGHQMSERIVLESFTEMARNRGLTPTSHVLSAVMRPCTFQEATALAVAPASPVLETHRLRSLDAVPTCLDVSVIPLSRAAGLEGISLEDVSLYETLETVAGLRIVRSDYTVRAEAADQTTARHLGIEPGAPLLVGEEVAYDASGAAIILGQATYRNEAYHFQATLFRRVSTGATST